MGCEGQSTSSNPGSTPATPFVSIRSWFCVFGNLVGINLLAVRCGGRQCAALFKGPLELENYHIHLVELGRIVKGAHSGSF